MKLGNFKITHKGLYWGLILTFGLLYLLVAFVSTLHAIDFFKLANVGGLAVLLGVAYEIGQASVLFSILMTKNRDKFLPWALMILLTALQMTANVYASFKHMVTSGSTDWMFWQKSILFGVQASSPEMYQIIISWISGALLPIVALGMTALVAQNIQMMAEESIEEQKPEEPKKPEITDEPIITKEEQFESLKDALLANTFKTISPREQNAPIDPESGMRVLERPLQVDLRPQTEMHKVSYDDDNFENYKPKLLVGIDSAWDKDDHLHEEAERLSGLVPEVARTEEWRDVDGKMHPDHVKFVKEQSEINEALISDLSPDMLKYAEEKFGGSTPEDLQPITDAINDKILDDLKEMGTKKMPQTLQRGWHLKKHYVDSNGDVYVNGIFSPEETQKKPSQPEELKKA